MRSTRLTFSILFLLLGLTIHSQETEKRISFAQKIGKTFSEIDTTYITPYKYNLAFMVEHSLWHEHYKIRTNVNGHKQSISLAPTPTPKIGAYFGWRWIFLGLSVSIPELVGNSKPDKSKQEYVFNLYSSRVGVDLYYRKTGSNFRIKSYSGFDIPDTYIGQKFDGLKSKIVGLNAYWIFNNKRFSYPAAYSQSTNQRISCGSFMAGFSYSKHNVTFDHTKLPDDMESQIRPSMRFNTLKYQDYNLSFGYGYNWVFAPNCLFNISVMPALAYKKTKLNGEEVDEEKKDWLKWMNDINFDIITRAAITWNNEKYFVGASYVMNTYDYRKKDFSMTHSFGGLRIYAGFNFWKQKKYRNNKN
nr:DUF4421 domain-containing protein [uncultured Bacteroides sp.]